SPSQPSNAGSPNQIPLDQIKPNPHQPRRVMNESSIAELAASLKTTGLIQPVIVRQTPDGFQLIAGERRWRAAKVAGLSTIPAIIRDVNSFEQAQMALIENIQREDLNPIDRAESYRSLINQLGLTQAELAGRLGEDRSSIANHLRLLELAEPVRNLIRDQKISLGHAKLLAGITNPAEQERLSNLVVDQQLSVRALEQMLQATTTDQPPAKDQPKLSAHIQDLERSISRQLGMKVQLRSARKGAGKLVISYASLDQFDELMMRLNVETE
ncbi:MAG TPA: ParB/RepB/Spo0J family partition protein, partial [Tepidisphaeraceae bacterium]|nr:ParB/RepB/Spo0J family partition protein [Tepidisphaeraceae bacterium]